MSKVIDIFFIKKKTYAFIFQGYGFGKGSYCPIYWLGYINKLPIYGHIGTEKIITIIYGKLFLTTVLYLRLTIAFLSRLQ